MNLKSILLTTLISLLLISCGSVPRTQTKILKYAQTDEMISITESKTILLSTGYNTSIIEGTDLKYIGDIPKGKVYKPIDSVLMIEGTNMYQAYLVLQNEQLIGFYLPASKEFSNSLTTPLKLKFIKE